MFFAATFAGCSQNDQAPGTASPTVVPYPDTEDNINNYNNGLALEKSCWSGAFKYAPEVPA